jgi:hypothetical protein
MRSADESPILARLLVHLRHFDRRPGEDERAAVHRWLGQSEPGRRLVAYLADEAGLLAMAANRLNLSGDDELREIGLELGRSAERIWTVLGTPRPERH